MRTKNRSIITFKPLANNWYRCNHRRFRNIKVKRAGVEKMRAQLEKILQKTTINDLY